MLSRSVRIVSLSLGLAYVIGVVWTAPARADFLAAAALDDSIVRFNDSGRQQGYFVSPGSGGLNSPFSMAWAPDGSLFVGASGGIYVYDGNTGAYIRNVPVPAGTGWSGLTFLPGGDLLGSSLWENAIYRLNPTTGQVLAKTSIDSLTSPAHLLPAPNGQVLVATGTRRNGGYLHQFDPSTNTLSIWGSSGVTAPMGIVYGPDGMLYSSDVATTGDIYRVNPVTGQVLGQFGINPGEGAFGATADLAFVNDSTLWGVGLLNGLFGRYDAQTGEFLYSLPGIPDCWSILKIGEPYEAVPEPSLLGIALAGLVLLRPWRRPA